MTDLIETTATEMTHHMPQLSPAQVIAHATETANVISKVIEDQKMYSVISGRKYVKVDAWVALGAIEGIFPREKSVHEVVHDNGHREFEAYVELIDKRTGRVIGGGSATCGTDESTWAKRPRFARRSMAITRATGKAFRLHYSYVMELAGYAPTPYEEMPEPEIITYTGTDSQREILATRCKKEGLDEAQTDAVLSRMVNKEFRQAVVNEVIAEVK